MENVKDENRVLFMATHKVAALMIHRLVVQSVTVDEIKAILHPNHTDADIEKVIQMLSVIAYAHEQMARELEDKIICTFSGKA